ncbi:Uu.00g015300.m01.CDS01 [Anthostomella pinea]|uniref:Uu.00g015300.m01.CDS01 n=1 Tax=Anthostomella pinea TaxID=933095 RepID=A0AAI8VYI2_9PEZI|nr:Uu.00g015300.m01.CDS01 [Anthostomella pinea]
MGSLNTSASKDELTVLVTGFSPFKEQYPVNPSYEIAASLPDYLPADRPKDPAHQSPASLPPVRIAKLPAAVRTSYAVAREIVPTIWDDAEHTPDFVVHIGMAGPQLVYQLERRGHRDGYDKRDVDGRLLGDEERRRDQGDDWVWAGVPEELLTDLDVEDVHRRWVERSPKNLNLQISDDAGHYLCDFIYFSSLAHLWKQQRPRKVVFLHVPLHPDRQSLERGRELVLTLIRSIVESEMSKKAKSSAEL